MWPDHAYSTWVPDVFQWLDTKGIVLLTSSQKTWCPSKPDWLVKTSLHQQYSRAEWFTKIHFSKQGRLERFDRKVHNNLLAELEDVLAVAYSKAHRLYRGSPLITVISVSIIMTAVWSCLSYKACSNSRDRQGDLVIGEVLILNRLIGHACWVVLCLLYCFVRLSC